MTLLVFILILSILIFVHELGHFVVAKLNGIRVEEFGFGIPPRLFGKKFGETIYSLNLLPFGGFVKLTGEDSEGDEDSSEEKVLTPDPRSFMSKTPWQRAAVLIAGVTMNFLLAITLFYVFMVSHDFKSFELPYFIDHKFDFGTTTVTETVVADISQDLPAKNSNLKIGDVVSAVDGVEISTVADFRKQLEGKAGNEVILKIRTLEGIEEVSHSDVILTPTLDEKGNTIAGVYLASVVVLSYDSSLSEKLLSGPMHAWNMLSYSTHFLGSLISVAFERRDISPVSSSVSGPIGIYQMVGGILEYGGERAFLTLIDYVALMSLSLGFINILPFPALDGGRLVFVMIEGITKKRFNQKIEAHMHRWGMLILIALMILVTIKDIR